MGHPSATVLTDPFAAALLRCARHLGKYYLPHFASEITLPEFVASTLLVQPSAKDFFSSKNYSILMNLRVLDRRIAELQLDGYIQYAASSFTANMYYLTAFLTADPFLFLRSNKKSLLVVSGMERKRAARSSVVDEVHSRDDYLQGSRHIETENATAGLIASVLSADHIKRVGVDDAFPIALADALRSMGYDVQPLSGLIEEQRKVKSIRELKLIQAVQHACETALDSALDVLRRSKTVGEELHYGGAALTSERLKTLLGCALIQQACSAPDTIASSGKDSALPHAAGAGPIEAHSPIVLDIFPQSVRSRYRSDMARTVVRGEPQNELSEMYEAVLHAQQVAFDMLKAGITGAQVHAAVEDHFKQSGFHTDLKNGYGFIHSTGHGVGLDVHELPFLNKKGDTLAPGNVVTVEPGLYYPDIGGVRLEDVVVITKSGNKSITRFEKKLVI